MSVEALKQELAALGEKDQRHLMAFLVSLQDGRDANYPRKLAGKIDKPASESATIDGFDSRLK